MENQSGQHFKSHGIHRDMTPIYSFQLLVGELCFSTHQAQAASGKVKDVPDLVGDPT